MVTFLTSKPGARPLRALTEKERSTIVNALHVASHEYDRDAANAIVRMATDGFNQGEANLIAAFQRQAVEARALAEIIEQTDEITVRK